MLVSVKNVPKMNKNVEIKTSGVGVQDKFRILNSEFFKVNSKRKFSVKCSQNRCLDTKCNTIVPLILHAMFEC